MCRLLIVKSEKEFNPKKYLEKFSKISKNSEEYQGHGWGCSLLRSLKNEIPEWSHYKNIKPIWEDDLTKFPKTKMLIAHARSAFENKGITVENNMPFHDEKYVFIFNGELKGVRIKEKGRIGAEKIFNYIKRFNRGNMLKAIKKAVEIIKKRTRKLKAMNIIISDGKKVYVSTNFNERPKYFTLHKKKGKDLIICSEPLDNKKWTSIKNNTTKVFT